MTHYKNATVVLTVLLLALKGFDRSFGARPMGRLIERVVKKPLSEALLFGSLGEGGVVRIVVQDGEIRLA